MTLIGSPGPISLMAALMASMLLRTSAAVTSRPGSPSSLAGSAFPGRFCAEQASRADLEPFDPG